MLMPEPGTKRQWNISCEEIKAIEYMFIASLFQRISSNPLIFKILLLLPTILRCFLVSSEYRKPLFYTMLLGQDFFVLWVNCQPINLFPYVTYVVLTKACAHQ